MRRSLKKAILSLSIIYSIYSIFIGSLDVIEAFSANFSVTAVIPENQVNTNSSFFDITMSSGDQQTLEVVLTNTTDEEVKVIQSVNTATTNSNGVVEYGISEMAPDNTLMHSFADIATIEAEVLLQPNSSETVSLDIHLPETTFEGTLLGGIFFQEVQEEENSNQAVQIQNEYAYVVGIQIAVGDIETIHPELKLNEIVPTQINRRNVVTANIQNIHPAGIRDLSVDAKVYRGRSNQVYRETYRENMRIAPNSNFDFPISWDNEAFQDGTYTLELTAKADGEVWNWRETFVIGDSNDLNEGAIVEPNNFNYTNTIIATIIFFGIIGIIVWSRKRDRDKEDVEM